MPRRSRLPVLLSGGFTPASLGNLVAWYDASVTSSLTTDRAVTTLVAADGDVVGAVKDLSGNGKHLVALSDGQRGVYKAAISPTGRGVVRSPGPSATVGTASLAVTIPAIGTQGTMFFTGRKVPGRGLPGGPAGLAVIGNAGFCDEGTWWYHQTQALSNVSSSYALVPFRVGEVVWNSTSSCSFYVDGNLVSTFDPQDSYSTNTTLNLFYRATGGNVSSSEMGEWIVYSRALSDGDRTQVRNYLTAKWCGFEPFDITGYYAHYDFGDPNTMYTDAAMTTLVSADAQTVLGVRDISGNLRHITEATNGPAYKVGIKNGRSVARFDGSNDKLTRSANVAQPHTVIAVANPTATTENKYIFGGGSGFAGGFDATGHMTMYANSFITGTPVSAGAWHIFTYVFDGASSKMMADSTTDGTGNPGTAGTGTSLPMLGSHSGAGNFLGMDLAEVIWFNSAVSDADLATLRGYLKSKWATP